MKVNGREVSNRIAVPGAIGFFLLFGIVAYGLFTWEMNPPDYNRIVEMLADGTWTKHIRDGRYFGHYSCNWGASTTVAVEVKEGRIEEIEVLGIGHSDNPDAEAYRQRVLRTQQPPVSMDSPNRGACEMHGAIRHALRNADYDTRTKPYHPVPKAPPRP